MKKNNIKLNKEEMETMTHYDQYSKSIFAERKKGKVDALLENTFIFFPKIKKDAVLILGDAALNNTEALYNKFNFKHIVNIDKNKMVWDEIFPYDKNRLKIVQTQFLDYQYKINTFDFIYGKAITHNPKDKIEQLLFDLRKSLKPDGIFSAVWAGEKDKHRKFRYGYDELLDLYRDAGFSVEKSNDYGKRNTNSSENNTTAHNIHIVASKMK